MIMAAHSQHGKAKSVGLHLSMNAAVFVFMVIVMFASSRVMLSLFAGGTTRHIHAQIRHQKRVALNPKVYFALQARPM
jgi:hypothetical protein